VVLHERTHPRLQTHVWLVLVLGLIGSTTWAPERSQAAAAARARGTGALLGAYVQPEDWSKVGQKASINDLEDDLGRTLDVDHLFFKWNGNVFPNWRQRWDKRNGRIPMISWGGTYLADILDGSYDAMIRERANALKALRTRVFLRWFGEMDAAIYDGDEITSPEQFITAWRYVHDIFVAEGATEVKWVWCPNAFNFATGRSQQFYPGDDYVDWICADGYNWAPDLANASWNSFKDIFAAFYEWAEPKPQPLMIGETGVLENAAGDKAAWITRMGRTINRVYPDIKALVYFDAYATANFGGWYDFRIDTSTSSYEAFIALANKPFFNRRG
jgi:glycosyl hydrolase family 26